MRLLAILTMFMLLAGCVAEVDETEAVDPISRFDPHICDGHWHVDRASFVTNAPEAIAMLEASPVAWARFSGRPQGLTLDYEVGQGCTIRAVPEAPPGFPERASGRYDDKTGDIVIVTSRSPLCSDGETSCLGSLILHEIGHGMGMHHTERGVLGASVIEPFWSYEDHTECVRVEACNADPNWTPVKH